MVSKAVKGLSSPCSFKGDLYLLPHIGLGQIASFEGIKEVASGEERERKIKEQKNQNEGYRLEILKLLEL